jgi:hypothetical protein
MKCEKCGQESPGDGIGCPQCGKTGIVAAPPVGAPGEVGQASSNGSDEVRESKAPAPPTGAPQVAASDGQLGRVIESAGG